MDPKTTSHMIEDGSTTENEAIPEKSAVLPLDIIELVAQRLIIDNSHRTCSALNVTSDAVYQRTIRCLYQTFVSWTAEAHERVPPVWEQGTGGWVKPETKVQDDERAAVATEWEGLMGIRGAQHMEFLGVPFCALTDKQSEAILGRLLGVEQGGILSRLKATISWTNNREVYRWRCFSPGYDDSAIIVNIGKAFRYGTDDILRLGQAIHQFREADDDESDLVGERRNVDGLVVNIWSGPNSMGGRHLVGKHKDSSLFDYRNDNFGIPRDITINAPALPISGDALVAAYLDVSALASGSEGSVRMNLTSVDQLVSYAKAFRRLVTTNPELVKVYANLTLPPGINVASLSCDIDRVLAIFRGTFISALDTIGVSPVGGVCIDFPTNGYTRTASVSCHTKGYKGYVYQLVTEFYWRTSGPGHSRTRETTLYKDALAEPPYIPSVASVMAEWNAFEEGAMAALSMDDSDGE